MTPTDPQGAEGRETRRSPMGQALLLDAKQLEALGFCGCFEYEEAGGVTQYKCANHPTTITRHPLGGTERE